MTIRAVTLLMVGSEVTEEKWVSCGYCNGTGRIKQPGDRKGRTMPCPVCNGTGKVKRG